MERGARIYTQGDLRETQMNADPMLEFSMQWALAENQYGEDVGIMSLSTVCAKLRPHSRMVLLKKQEGRCFDFYTQYRSHKASELAFSPFGALLFFWPELGKQIRVEGAISMISESESAAYFATRPRESQIGAWASAQSASIESREALDARVRDFEAQFGSGPVPYPPHWGGYRLTATMLEFWQGRSARLHDRIAYVYEGNGWTRNRLCP